MFFFFKQKTAYEMRISDWSSDVCSSDLNTADGMQTTVATALPRMLGRHRRPAITHFGGERGQLAAPSAQQRVPARGVARASVIAVCGNAGAEIGRAHV